MKKILTFPSMIRYTKEFMSLALKACFRVAISYMQQPKAQTSDCRNEKQCEWKCKGFLVYPVSEKQCGCFMLCLVLEIPCGCRVCWREVLDSCNMVFQWGCLPCHSGSPILVQSQGLQLWLCWSWSERYSGFSNPDARCAFHANTMNQ